MKRVLYVDDAENWREMMKMTLGDDNTEVRAVDSISGMKTYLIAHPSQIDRIITDGMEGKWKEVVELAKANRIPVALFTATQQYLNEAREEKIMAFNKDSRELKLIDLQRFIQQESGGPGVEILG